MLKSFGAVFGAISVTEEDNKIYISGIRTHHLFLDIKYLWRSTRVINSMFINVGTYSLVFDSFFGIDVLYILKEILDSKKRMSSEYRLNKSIELILENTWVSTINRDHKSILDMKQLKQLHHDPFPHQFDAFKAYDEKVPKMNLLGYLLAADVGTGKTFISLALSACLKAGAVIMVCPKSILNTVWVDSIKEEFGDDVSLWSSDSKTPINNRFKFYVVHYEALDKIISIAPSLKSKNPMIVLDESHNFNDANSVRSKALVNLCKRTVSKHIIFASGTAIKALGYEVITLLRCIDPLFNDDVEKRFRLIYGLSSKKAVDILRNRIDLIGHKIPKSVVMKTAPPITERVEIKIPNWERYTIESVRVSMKDYITERMDFYGERLADYYQTFDRCVEIYRSTIDSKVDIAALEVYLDYVDIISDGYVPQEHKIEATYCTRFEKTKIRPVLNSQDKKAFQDAKSVVKYVHLKVLGEALGNILGKMRIECHVEMVKHSNFDEIIKDADKKAIGFSSFVEVIKEASDIFKKKDLDSVLVYGKTNKDVANIVKKFQTDPDCNPLLATYKSLSTGVTLIEANVCILFDLPFREYIREQAVHRIYRIGQEAQTYIYECVLWTKDEPNISTRAGDIMEWSKTCVESIMGIKIDDDEMETVVRNLSKDVSLSLSGLLQKAKRLIKQ